ncbi:hypothetical protein D3C72_1356000 [compost metagenome]
MAICSEIAATQAIATKMTVMDASTATPCRLSPTISPKVKHSAAGIRKIASISMRLARAFGFSNGCAELALKKPPPLVPSILIASCEATGPIASVCLSVFRSSVTGLPCASSTGCPAASSLGWLYSTGVTRLASL